MTLIIVQTLPAQKTTFKSHFVTPSTTHNALPGGYQLLWYRIEHVLGRGSFGVTYLATDTNLHRKVAIKEYLPFELCIRAPDFSVHAVSDEELKTYQAGLQRFLVEARTLAKFKHPNIVRAHNVFESNQTAYMAMEYEHGESLAVLINRQEIQGEERVLKILYPMLDALDYIHEVGFIHRDIKPGNIFIREDDTPVLLDFGSTRIAPNTDDRTLTRLVSRGYAPHEQYGGDADKQGEWTDIYAMGATLYSIVCGRSPIDAIERANARLEGRDDPLLPACVLGAGTYSEQFLRAIDKSMNVMPADRPGSIGTMRKLFQATDASLDLPPDGHSVDAHVDFTRFNREEPPLVATSSEFRFEPGPGMTGMRNRPSGPKRKLSIWHILIVLSVLVVAVFILRSPLFFAKKEQQRPVPPVLVPDLPRKAIVGHKRPPQREPEKPSAQSKMIFLDTLLDGSKGPEMVVILASRLATDDFAGRTNQPLVATGNSFALGRYEVSFAEYGEFVKAAQARSPSDGGWGRGNRPVMNVSWHDAVAYAEWLSEQTGEHYRLPTEAEWDYAARAGSETEYWWGDDISHNMANCDGCGSSWDGLMTAPVGSFKPNPFGLYDTAGNVWEWVEDCSSRATTLTLDSESPAESCRERVLRGGAWNTNTSGLVSAKRNGDGPELHYRYVGFRVAREMSPASD